MEASCERERSSLFVCLSFGPRAHGASPIARLLSDFCEVGLGDLDITSRFHMATHELAENLAKYSTASRASLEIELAETESGHLLSVRTRNQASPERLSEAEPSLQELKAATDPVEYYDRVIKKSAPIEGISGLGLARIRAEGGFDFDYAIEGNELTLVVRTPVPKPALLGG